MSSRHRLLIREQATSEWEWVEGMCFSRTEEEDYLVELLLYTWRTSGRSDHNRNEKPTWRVTPLHRKKREGDDLEWFFEKKDVLEKVWDFQRANDNIPYNDRKVLECQCLKLLSVDFEAVFSIPHLEGLSIPHLAGNLENNLDIFVHHMICCDTLDAFYYMNIGAWFARCRSVQECVDFFDIIATNKDRILLEHNRYYNAKEFITSLNHSILLEKDPVRQAYLQRKINEIMEETKSMRIIEL